jgi:hypothetical protein
MNAANGKGAYFLAVGRVAISERVHPVLKAHARSVDPFGMNDGRDSHKIHHKFFKCQTIALSFASWLTHGNDSYGNGPFRFIADEKLSEIIDLKEHTRWPQTTPELQ